LDKWLKKHVEVKFWHGVEGFMDGPTLDFMQNKLYSIDNNEDMTDKEIKIMLTAIARQYNKGDIFDPKKGAWIDIDHYVRMYKDTPQKDLVIDRLYANVDDIKVKQGINLLDARTRNWRK
jgi:hypothetical protein